MATVSNRGAQDQVFRDALAILETCLATPIVAGELVEWARNADEAMCNFMIRWLERRDVSHQRLLLQIAEDDPELSAKVEQLRRENDQIIKDGQQLAETV